MKLRASLLGLSLTLSVHASNLSEKIDSLIQEALPHAQVGVLVQDAASGEALYERNASQFFYPASSTKLFLAAANYYQLGEGYQFETTLSQKNKTLYFQFTGDPSLKRLDIENMLRQLSTQQPRMIEGDVVIDGTRFREPDYLSGVTYDDLGWYYCAPSSAIVIDENAAPYTLTTGEIGRQVRIISKSARTPLHIQSELKTVASATAKKHCTLNIAFKPNNTLKLYGCFAKRKQPALMQFAIPSPMLYAKNVIKEGFKAQRMVLKGEVVEGRLPKGSKTLVRHQSKPLSYLLAHMLEESDNLYAANLTKLLGYTMMHEGSTKQGVYAMKQVLKTHTHIDMHQVYLKDGVGTRYNMTTPAQFVTLLNDLYRDEKARQFFMQRLPKMGESGTLKERMKETPLVKHVFAKTGTMHDISSLSGYLVLPSGKTITFSIMSNGVNVPIARAKALEDQILLALIES